MLKRRKKEWQTDSSRANIKGAWLQYRGRIKR